MLLELLEGLDLLDLLELFRFPANLLKYSSLAPPTPPCVIWRIE